MRLYYKGDGMMYLHGTSRVNNNGHLEIGGMDTTELTREYGTPLYVYDIELVRQKAKLFIQTFHENGIQAQVAYASKAFCTVGMLQVIAEEGLSLDVVSGGELFTALQAKFPMERIHFHGNNKSYEELEMALQLGIGCFIVDNFLEIHMLKELTKKLELKARVLLRLAPGVEAHTHEYISTGKEDSKFGFDLESGVATNAVKLLQDDEYIELLGVHYHIGSQIFDMTAFYVATEKVWKQLEFWRGMLDFCPQVVNVGGGFGIRYTEEDKPLSIREYTEHIIQAVKKSCLEFYFDLPEIWIEPGRALVGDAGTTLYTTGAYKKIPNVRDYVSVDGGMSDNIRLALYQAKYEAALANRMNEKADTLVSIAGKSCESGDMLIWDIHLPTPQAGDVLAISCTGAYCYSMASNYNRLPRPAVVFVENEHAKVVVKRETYEDIVRLDNGIPTICTI